MGAYTMRCTLRLLASVMILAAPAAALAQSPRYNVGTPLSQDEIKSFDFMIGPQGQALPPGHGTAKEGAVIFAKRCEVCHGKNGESGVLTAGAGQARSTFPRPVQSRAPGQRRLLPLCDDRVGLYQPCDARPEAGNAHA